MKKFAALMFLFLLICFTSCKKKKEPLPVADPYREVVLEVVYKTDNGSFQTAVMNNTTSAGYPFSVTKLEYFLSQICLLRKDSSTVLLREWQYVDAIRPETNRFTCGQPPPGDYIGISFNIGLLPAQNVTATLPDEADNINMQWPEPMGGGYHFFKMEGNYKDGLSTQGYAMHLGTNKCLMPIRLFRNFSISENSSTTLKPTMNINSWFRSPYKFDFNTDGNYIMGNDAAMLKIAANGQTVFSLTP